HTEAPIGVRTEWGTLKECIYGWADQFTIPKFLTDSKARAYGDFEKFWVENQGRPVAEADFEYFAAVKRQLNDAVNILKSLGIKVHQPARVSDANMLFPRGENHGCMTPWLRDPFVT